MLSKKSFTYVYHESSGRSHVFSGRFNTINEAKTALFKKIDDSGWNRKISKVIEDDLIHFRAECSDGSSMYIGWNPI